MYAIGIDVGSTNAKAVLVDEVGRVVEAASRPLRTAQAGDTVVQDADELWSAVVDAVQELTSAAPHEAAEVVTIGVCSQYSSLVPVDVRGQALGPILMYMDLRGSDACWAIMERHPDAFGVFVDRHGIPPIGGGLSLAHLLHMQLAQPELHARTAAYLEVMDLVNLRLTGRAVANQCSAFAMQLCDNRVIGSTRYDDDLVDLSGVDAARLPELIEIDGVVGEVMAPIAAQLGLPAGVVVRAAMNDTQADAFATGAFAADRCGVLIGTTAVLVQSADGHRVDLEHEVLTMPAPLPGRHLVMAENGIAGRAVEHAFALLRIGFDDVPGALAGTEPGAGGLLFLPWLGGSMSPAAQPSMRGGFLGLSLTTSREDMVRSVLEGTAHNLRWLLPAVEALSGHHADELVFGGGAARSPEWARILCDVLGRPVSVLDRPDVAVAVAVGLVALRRAMGDDPLDLDIRVGARLEPDLGAVSVHSRMQESFVGAFEANRSICEALSHE